MEDGAIPEKFGDYVTLRDEKGEPVVLGSGGFGTTICAYRSRFLDGKEIRHDGAVKVLRNEAISDPKRRRSFIEEIIALSELQHPNLVRYIDCGEQDGSIFMVMDLCRGGDLERLVRKLGPFSERAALQAVLQICAGLDEAHRKGYLHRDLKPRNVLLAEPCPADGTMEWLEDGLARHSLRLKIVDFGLSGRLGSENTTNGFVGSPMFASPEQVRQRRDLDARSDIYSLGMSLWFLVTGKGPLLRADGEPIDDAKEAMRAQTSPIPHDIAFASTLSPEFRQLLSRMVKKPREERFATLEELVRAIRLVLEKVPGRTGPGDLIAAPSGASDLRPLSLPRQPAWGRGKFGDFYGIVGEVGRRSVGKLYRATLDERIENQYVAVPKQSEVRLTAWISDRPLDDPMEIDLAEYLARLWALTWSALAPPSLARMLEVRRTTTEWCVCEEWVGGLSLEAAVAARGGGLTMVEAAALLMPVAEAADFLLQNQIESALLDIEDIRLFHYDSATVGGEWLSQPVRKWGNWGLQVSALAVPTTYTGGSSLARNASATISAGSAIDISQLPFSKSFARLIYRVMQRSEAPEAADWDVEAYYDCPKLTRESNALLAAAISGTGASVSASELLRGICNYEGVFDVPASASATASRRSLSLTSRYIESSASVSSGESSMMDTVCLASAFDDEPELDPDAPTIVDPIKPLTRVGPPPASRSQGASVSRGSASASVARSTGPAPLSRPIPAPPPLPPPLPTVEVAEIVPGEPRTVRSPYGAKRTQRVRGPEWRPGATVTCAETRRPFRLPESLPPLEAVLIPGRCDTVLSPYQEPPGTMPLPPAAWAPGAPISCVFTNMPLTMPRELPAVYGTPVETRPGVVRSPFSGHAEVVVSPDDWQPDARIRDAVAVADFLLPAKLPPLLAQPSAETGIFISPYAPDAPFTLPPHRCMPTALIDCPKTGKPLAIPFPLPTEWRFTAEVRQAEEPEARSPFIEQEESAWQPLAPDQWQSGARVECRRSKLKFYLPDALPVLRVAPAEKPPAIRSPFAPHPAVPIEPEHWQPGAEFSLPLSGATARVRLEAEQLAPLEALAVAERTGAFRSPFAPTQEFDVAPPACIPGELIECPFTHRPLRLPARLPANWHFEGEVRQADAPEARSPFVGDEASAWQALTPEQWRPRGVVKCRTTGRDFSLPAELPALDVAVCEEHSCILSPFPPHGNVIVRADEWHAGAEFTAHLPGGHSCRVRLPADARPIGHVPPEKLTGLPQGYDAQLHGAGGAIRSPHGAQQLVEISPTEWMPGRRVICPETKRAFWLPAELPPLTAALGAAPGTIVSPFTGREIAIDPKNWKPGALVNCTETGACIALPSQLPLLVGTVDTAKPGQVASPFAPEKPLTIPFEQWTPKRELECRLTRRKFRLPDQLPEWILDAEIFNPAQALVRSPLPGREAFRVEGLHWMPGKIVSAPNGERLTLPKNLPPLQAEVLAPGSIRSPYAPSASVQRVPRAQWRPGATLTCAATSRPLQLPQDLPAFPEPQTARFVMLGAAALAVIGLIIGGIWFATRDEKPVTPVVVDGGGAPTPEPEPAALTATPEWPKTFVFQDGTTPAPPAAVIRLVSGAKTSEPLPARVESGVVTVDLAAALAAADFAGADELKLQVSAPGFAPQTLDLKKVRSGRDLHPERLVLRRESGEVRFAGTRLPFYTQVQYTSTDGDASRDVILDLKDAHKVSAGTYKVTLFSKDTRFAEKLLADKLAIDASRPLTLELPPFPFPRALAGVTKRETIGSSNRVFKSRTAPNRLPTINAEQFILHVWSPELIIWDDATFTGGYLYETNTAALVTAIDALDNICFVALNLSAGKANKQFEEAPDTAKISALAQEFHDAAEQELTASPREQRSKLRAAARSIRALLPDNLRSVFPDQERQKLVASYMEIARIFIDQLSEKRDAEWAALIESARGGKAPPPAVLEKLSEPIAGLPGILVKNRMVCIGYDGQKALQLKIERYQGRAKPLNWLPSLEVTGNGTWRLTDEPIGGETAIVLREAK